MVTHQLQVKRRTGKVRRPETDVLPLCHATNLVICLEGAKCRLAQMMPLPLTVSCFSKIQISFTFLVPAYPGSPGKRVVKRVCLLVLKRRKTYERNRQIQMKCRSTASRSPVLTRDPRHLRSANRHLLAVPRFRLNTYGRRAFSVAGPMAWNSLPDFIRDPASSTDCLGVYLKRTCSRVTSASSALGILDDYALHKFIHLYFRQRGP